MPLKTIKLYFVLSGIPSQNIQAIPQRGSKAYFRYKYKAEPRPPSNWSHFECNKTIKELLVKHSQQPFKLVKPDNATFQSIKNLFLNTIGINGARVVSIKRNENLKVFEKYIQDCQRLFCRAISKGPCKSLANTPRSRGSVTTLQYVNRTIANQLDQDLNEVYLFHGTKKERVDVLLQNGLDPRLAAMNFPTLWLGAGVYAAEEASLSHKYTPPGTILYTHFKTKQTNKSSNICFQIIKLQFLGHNGRYNINL